MKAINLSLYQKFILWLFGRVRLGDHTEKGWKGPLDEYAFVCPTHGLVKNWLKGYYKRLECPLCFQDEVKERETR